MANKIPVGDTIGFAYSNTFGNILPLLGLTWLPLAIVAGIGVYAQSMMFDMFSKLPLFATGHPDPQQAIAALSGMMNYAGLGFLVWLVTWFMWAVVGVAVVSQALGVRTGQTFVHLAAGAPEWRVFGGYVRLFFAVLGLYLLAIVGVFVAVFIGQAIGSSVGGIVSFLLCAAIVCLFILTLVRMSFVMTPSIVMEPGKGGLARSYHLTRGNFWRIFVVFLVLVLPVIIVQQAVLGAILGNSMMGPILRIMQQAQSGSPATPEQLRDMFTAIFQSVQSNIVPMAIIGFVSSFFLSTLTLSGASFAYRALSGGATEAAPPIPAPTPTPTPAA